MNEKKTWSLQNDKRTEAERNIFKSKGVKPKNKTLTYLVSLAGLFLLVSFFMTFFSETLLEACVFKNICFVHSTSVALLFGD